MQDINLNQLKLKVNDTSKKDEKLTTNFEPSNDEDVIKKASSDKKVSKIEGHFSYIAKDYHEFELLSNRQSVEEVLNRGAVKTTVKILYDKGLFDIYGNGDEALEDFLFVERCGPDLEELNDDVIQRFHIKIQFEINKATCITKMQQIFSCFYLSDVGI